MDHAAELVAGAHAEAREDRLRLGEQHLARFHVAVLDVILAEALEPFGQLGLVADLAEQLYAFFESVLALVCALATEQRGGVHLAE